MLDALGSHFLLPFELDGRQRPVPHVLAFRIVEHLDVVEHVLPCLGARLVGPTPYSLALEQVDEILGDSIVVVVPAPAHRVLHSVAGEFFSRDSAPKPTDAFKSPLNLTFHVRATDPDPLGMDIRMSASVSYSAAVEEDETITPRRGELLMWQNGTTGAGTPSRLEAAIITASKKRMDEILGHIKESWQR